MVEFISHPNTEIIRLGTVMLMLEDDRPADVETFKREVIEAIAQARVGPPIFSGSETRLHNFECLIGRYRFRCLASESRKEAKRRYLEFQAAVLAEFANSDQSSSHLNGSA